MLRRPKGWLVLTLASSLAACASTQSRPPPARSSAQRVRLAFVLLTRPEMPRAAEIVAAFRRMEPTKRLPPLEGARREGDTLVLDLGAEGSLVVGLIPRPVPEDEAEWYARFSLPAVSRGWKLPAHRAHLVVAWQESASLAPLDSLRRFTWLLAATVEASHAVAVYWPDAGATYPADSFIGVAGSADPTALMLVWSGVRVAPDGEKPDRTSLVSLGMSQLGLPDLEVSVPWSLEKGKALERLYALLGYVALRGAPMEEGDTIGNDAMGRLPARRVRSPADPAKKVWRVEIPEQPK
jgi:hypothetical protein